MESRWRLGSHPACPHPVPKRLLCPSKVGGQHCHLDSSHKISNGCGNCICSGRACRFVCSSVEKETDEGGCLSLTVFYSVCPRLVFCSFSVNLTAIFSWKATPAFGILSRCTGSAHYPVNMKVAGSEWPAGLCFRIRQLNCSGEAPSRAPPWALREQGPLTPHSQSISQTLLLLLRMKVKQNPSSWDLIPPIINTTNATK